MTTIHSVVYIRGNTRDDKLDMTADRKSNKVNAQCSENV